MRKLITFSLDDNTLAIINRVAASLFGDNASKAVRLIVREWAQDEHDAKRETVQEAIDRIAPYPVRVTREEWEGRREREAINVE